MVSKNIIGISRLFQHGKTQIPRDVRKLLSVEDGDRIYYILDDLGRVYIEKAPPPREYRGKYLVTA